MTTIHLEFPFRAISKDNEKIFNRQGIPFTTAKYKAFENHIKIVAISQYKGEMLEGDLQVDLTFHFTKKNHCDLYNLPKSSCDALQGIIYKSDRQIKKGTVQILYDLPDDMFEVDIKKLKERV